jgi:hypothetical protein
MTRSITGVEAAIMALFIILVFIAKEKGINICYIKMYKNTCKA